MIWPTNLPIYTCDSSDISNSSDSSDSRDSSDTSDRSDRSDHSDHIKMVYNTSNCKKSKTIFFYQTQKTKFFTKLKIVTVRNPRYLNCDKTLQFKLNEKSTI